MNEKEYKKISDYLLNGTITITWATALGYLATYIYLLTYFNYFGIPYYFIDIKLEQMILVGIFIFCIFCSLYFLLQVMSLLSFLDITTSKGKLIALTLVEAIVLLLLLVTSSIKFKYVLIIFLIIFFCIFYIYTKNKKVKQKNVYLNNDNKDKTLIGVFKGFLDTKLIVYLIVSFIVIVFSLLYGQIDSRYTKNFLVINEANSIIITKNNELLIGVNFEEVQNGEIFLGNDYSFININDYKNKLSMKYYKKVVPFDFKKTYTINN